MVWKIVRPDKTGVEAIYSLRRTFYVYAVIFILWGLYRLLLRFPIFLEEVFIKPLIFLPPVLSVLEQERSHRESTLRLFSFRRKNLLLSFYFGLTLGVSYFLAMGLGSLVFSNKEVFSVLQFSLAEFIVIFTVSFFTALWEQMVFAGFFLRRVNSVISDEWVSASVVGVLFTLLHLPILIFEANLQPFYLLVQLILLFMVGFGNSVLMLRTKNIVAPILSHLFWALALHLVV